MATNAHGACPTHSRPPAWRALLIAGAVVFASGAATPTHVAAQSARTARSARPNIIYIITDDHAAHAISAYGSRVNRTPHLDRFGERRGAAVQRVRHQFHLHAQSRRDPPTGQYSHLN